MLLAEMVELLILGCEALVHFTTKLPATLTLANEIVTGEKYKPHPVSKLPPAAEEKYFCKFPFTQPFDEPAPETLPPEGIIILYEDVVAIKPDVKVKAPFNVTSPAKVPPALLF